MPGERRRGRTEVLAPGERPDADLLHPGDKVGEFEIEARIGGGGMGAVYRAFQPVIQRRVALKVLANLSGKDAVERFMREARAAARVRHPGIPEVYTFGTLPNGRQYYVMELLEGEDLRARLKRGPIRPEEVLHVVEEVADALHAAHEQGIIHRDLKPENIFLATAPSAPFGVEVKLLDFGVAKLLETDGERDPLASAGLVIGTPVYMPPEQLLAGTVGPRSDVYALACVAFEMLAGRRPFDQRQTQRLVQEKTVDGPPSITDVAPALARFADPLATAMSSDAVHRFPTAPQFAAAMRQALTPPAAMSSGPDVLRTTLTGPLAAPRAPFPWVAVSVAIVLGLAVGLGLVKTYETKAEPPVRVEAPVAAPEIVEPPAIDEPEPVVEETPPPEPAAKKPKRPRSKPKKDDLLPDMPIRF